MPKKTTTPGKAVTPAGNPAFMVGDKVCTAVSPRARGGDAIYTIEGISDGTATLSDGSSVGLGYLRHPTLPKAVSGNQGKAAAPAGNGPTPVAPAGKATTGRTARWAWRSDDTLDGVLVITNGGAHNYLYHRVNDWTFVLTELGGGRRTDLYITLSPRGCSCGCGDWKKDGKCHHVECLTGLREAGKL
jgi:hypothetical protein